MTAEQQKNLTLFFPFFYRIIEYHTARRGVIDFPMNKAKKRMNLSCVFPFFLFCMREKEKKKVQIQIVGERMMSYKRSEKGKRS